ncbi:preprotein translocase subunit YajC [uncultured Oscillibacter sp.]|uniref:preprotein translocase subunit YajC n=1 Tax=uncultured Oscillibacter sp. TaxID=876091 RepID=UPI0025E9FD01|nr:preprotein translocase subunit YajC [uncultured Oscillibacter sp.]
MDTMTIAMLVLLILVFYFMVIRPENKRKKAAEELRNGLKKGDKITTIGGIVGTIVQVNDDTIVIETSDDRVRMELTKWAVSTTGVQTSTEPAAAKKSKEEPAEEPAAEEKENSDEKKPWDPEK